MEEGEEIKDIPEDSNGISDHNSKESSDTELLNTPETSKDIKDNDEVTDSTKDNSSDQESNKIDNLKKFKKKARGKFRLTTKTNKSKKFAVVQSDSYIKTINKAITDNASPSKPNEESNASNEEE